MSAINGNLDRIAGSGRFVAVRMDTDCGCHEVVRTPSICISCRMSGGGGHIVIADPAVCHYTLHSFLLTCLGQFERYLASEFGWMCWFCFNFNQRGFIVPSSAAAGSERFWWLADGGVMHGQVDRFAL